MDTLSSDEIRRRANERTPELINNESFQRAMAHGLLAALLGPTRAADIHNLHPSERAFLLHQGIEVLLKHCADEALSSRDFDRGALVFRGEDLDDFDESSVAAIHSTLDTLRSHETSA
jgi:hypothetical protein